MRLVGIITLSILSLIPAIFLVDALFPQSPNSNSTSGFWLSVFVTIVILCTCIHLGFKHKKRSTVLRATTYLVSGIIVIAGDYVIAVIWACGFGDCI